MTPAEQRSDENSSAAPAEIERLKQELSRAHDMRLRALADFDNYRKRVQREQDSAAQAGKRQLVLALLDVMDDFERALAYANTAPESILTGARVIHQRLTDLLQAQGVVPYTSAGQPFDADAARRRRRDQNRSGTVGSCARRTPPRVSVGR